MLKLGNRAPDFTLASLDGVSISLQEMLRTGSKVLLVFLRHLG